MVCINDGNTYFQFTHDPNTIYYSPDLDTGISATTTPAPGDVYNATIRVHNQGVAGNGEVALCVCPPGTGITSVLSYATLAVGVAACDPLNPNATTSAIVAWTVPSGLSHFCLAAMVRDTALGAPGYESPIVQTSPGVYQFSTPFNPYNTRSAQCNVSLVQGGGRAAPRPPPGPGPGGGRDHWCTDFAFAVVNPLRERIATQIVAYPVRPHDERLIGGLAKQSHIAKALEFGRFQGHVHAGLAVGRERVLQPPIHRVLPDVEHVEGRRQSQPGAIHSHFGHWGPISQEMFERLAVTPLRPEQTMTLVADEVRQAIVHICAPADARPGDLFGVDIRHELLKRGTPDQDRVLGGLVVILRIPHSDERQSSPAGKPAQKR